MSEMDKPKKQADLVYDVGMHKGEDTDYYLKKGFRVVGFEADPDLAAHCRARFSGEIANGRLIVVEGAITELSLGETERRTIKFYKNRAVSVWGTVASDWAQRNEVLGTSNEIIEVPVVDFSECLKKYDVPHYLKIDIEGMDRACLKALMPLKHRPDYVSIEAEKVSFDKLLEELSLLKHLGYTGFKAIQQRYISKQVQPNPSREGRYVCYQIQEGSSGLFGADLPYEWEDYEQICKRYKFIFVNYRLFGDYGTLGKYFVGKLFIRFVEKVLRQPLPGWYDTHARHSSVAS